jgi:hypothetical protein
MDIDMSLKQLEKSLGKFTYFQGKFLLKINNPASKVTIQDDRWIHGGT